MCEERRFGDILTDLAMLAREERTHTIVAALATVLAVGNIYERIEAASALELTMDQEAYQYLREHEPLEEWGALRAMIHRIIERHDHPTPASPKVLVF